VQVDAFVGNSIGAIIAAFLAQGADDELAEIWQDHHHRHHRQPPEGSRRTVS
jgi:predicted acylesterase/phospholipase RssA